MKLRLDQLLVEKRCFDNLVKARQAIMAGKVTVNGQLKDKAGEAVDSQALIQVKSADCPYVSRGGLKLEKGIAIFSMAIKDKVFIDIGSSSGGFTDCLLKNGAKKVYAVDVGYGQLDWKLRNDPRVIPLERRNFRYLSAVDIPEKADGTVMDVSFISVIKLLARIKELTRAGSFNIWLIKPQFEARREEVGDGGVIRDPEIHLDVLRKVLLAIEKNGFSIRGLDYSPIHGQKGNIEFLLYTENKEALNPGSWDFKIREVVDRAHEKKIQDKG